MIKHMRRIKHNLKFNEIQGVINNSKQQMKVAYTNLTRHYLTLRLFALLSERYFTDEKQ